MVIIKRLLINLKTYYTRKIIIIIVNVIKIFMIGLETQLETLKYSIDTDEKKSHNQHKILIVIAIIVESLILLSILMLGNELVNIGQKVEDYVGKKNSIPVQILNRDRMVEMENSFNAQASSNIIWQDYDKRMIIDKTADNEIITNEINKIKVEFHKEFDDA